MNPLSEFSPDELKQLRAFAGTTGVGFDELAKVLGVKRYDAIQFVDRMQKLGLAECEHLDDARPTKLLKDSLRELDSPPPTPYQGSPGSAMELIDHFNENERKILLRLAKAVDVNFGQLGYEEVGNEFGMSKREMVAFVQKLKELKLAVGHTNESFRVTRKIMPLVHRINNPPPPEPKDYPADFEKWFRGKPWSIPFYILFVGLPAIVGYIVMIQQILQWFGILEKSE